MELFSKSILFRIVLIGIISIIGIWLIYPLMQPRKLKIYAPSSEINPDLVDPELRKVGKEHAVGHFSLKNQNGKRITEKNYENKIYVADFFFTTCTNICIPMAEQMKRLQDEFMDDDEVMLLSHTVYPEVDSVEVLKEYATEKGVLSSKWNLVTGDKKEIYQLARRSYFASTSQGYGGVNDFIHTQNFILVDKEKRLRGFYDGTNPKETDRLIRDIRTLKLEYR